MVKNFYNSIGKLVANTVKDWPGFRTIAKKLENIPQRVHDGMYDVHRYHKNAFNVITHNDMFLNNILFRNDRNGQLIDIRFVSTLNDTKMYHKLMGNRNTYTAVLISMS